MQGGGVNRYYLSPRGMDGGRGDRKVSAVRKWKDGGMEIGVSGGERL